MRHLGVPSSGAADPLSLALANRLVGNASLQPALETTLTGATLRFSLSACVAVTGAVARCELNGRRVEQHVALHVETGDQLSVGSAELGVRSYIAVSGGFEADDILGSRSTYLTAGFGGFHGRALRDGDRLTIGALATECHEIETPSKYRVPMMANWSLRATLSVESDTVAEIAQLFDARFTIGRRSDRMGIRLEGATFRTTASAEMHSVPVFPGTLQCPQDGSPYLLCVDSGTTGGYPRIAKIARMDMHLLGQLRPGNRLSLIKRDVQQAAKELRQKQDYFRPWIGDIDDVI